MVPYTCFKHVPYFIHERTISTHYMGTENNARLQHCCACPSSTIHFSSFGRPLGFVDHKRIKTCFQKINSFSLCLLRHPLERSPSVRIIVLHFLTCILDALFSYRHMQSDAISCIGLRYLRLDVSSSFILFQNNQSKNREMSVSKGSRGRKICFCN